jgi:flagellar biosynthesis protein
MRDPKNIQGIDIREQEVPRGNTNSPQPPSITKAAAIEYERGSENAPRVTASGKGFVAEQILAIAFERGIKVREDAELVEVLSLIEVDSPIPLEAFAAVAEILAYVYQVNDARKVRPS